MNNMINIFPVFPVSTTLTCTSYHIDIKTAAEISIFISKYTLIFNFELCLEWNDMTAAVNGKLDFSA